MISISHSWRAYRDYLNTQIEINVEAKCKPFPDVDCESATSWATASVTRDCNAESSTKKIFLSRYELSAYLIIEFGKWILDTYIVLRAEVPHLD